MAKKAETKTDKIEREYVIPLREKCRPAVRYKKTPKAIKVVKQFLAKHMKVEGRDVKKVKLDMLLNEFLWAQGIKKPVHKVKVKVVKENGIVTAELYDLPKKLKDKKARLDKRDAKASDSKPKAPVVKKEKPVESEKKVEAEKTVEEELKEEVGVKKKSTKKKTSTKKE